MVAESCISEQINGSSYETLTAEQYRTRARMAWRCAERVTDEESAETLRSLAREYEARAAELEAVRLNTETN